MSVRRRGKKFVAQTYDPAKGGKVWVGTFDTKSEAKEAERETWKDLRNRSGRRKETVKSFADRWMDDFPRKRESTIIHNRERIRRFSSDYGHRDLRSFDRVEARAWALSNRPQLQAVRAMFTDAMNDGLVDSNPFTNLRLEGSRGRRDLVVPTEAELALLVRKAGELQGPYGRRVLGRLIQFGAYSGLRPGELYGLRWADIDFRAHTVTVERQFNQKTRTFTTTKTGRSRTIFLTPQAAEAAKATPRIRDEVFSAPRGGVLSGSVMSTYWQPVARAAGRPEFSPHCLRHFYGTHLANLGLSAPDIARQLGHTDGGVLALKVYIHAREDESNERAARLFGGNVRDLRAVEGGK